MEKEKTELVEIKLIEEVTGVEAKERVGVKSNQRRKVNERTMVR